MQPPTFENAVGALMGLIAMGVIAYGAMIQGDTSARGALVAVVAAAVGFFLRAKVQPPTQQTPPHDSPIVPHG